MAAQAAWSLLLAQGPLGAAATRLSCSRLLCAQEGQGTVAIVEVNSETDFVARNDMFKSLVATAAAAATRMPASSVQHAGHQLDGGQVRAGHPLHPIASPSRHPWAQCLSCNGTLALQGCPCLS